MDHGGTADTDTGVVDTVVGIALEEHQVSGSQVAHGTDQRPTALLRIAFCTLSADTMTALFHTVVNEPGAVEGIGTLSTPLVGLA